MDRYAARFQLREGRDGRGVGIADDVVSVSIEQAGRLQCDYETW